MFKRKPKSGYQIKPNRKKTKRSHYIASLIVAPTKKVSIAEKVVKFLIYIALRLVIKPSKWKDPKKNYEIIDRTYKRIMSADFIYIPSSIAFYLIMAFMPVLALITFMFMIPGFDSFLGTEKVGDHYNSDAVSDVLGKFIPGAKDLLAQIKGAVTTSADGEFESGALVATLFSLLVSTWIAAGGFSKLVFTQSYIYEHRFVGGYWMNKLRGMAMVIGLTLFLVFALGITATINRQISSSSLSWIWMKFFSYFYLIVGLFVGTFVLFMFLFKYSPRYRINFRDVVPGAMVTTIPTAGFLALFGTISSIWSYGNYGSVGVIMYVGMAALIITYFIFVGLTANAAYYKTFVSQVMRNKKTLSKK